MPYNGISGIAVPELDYVIIVSRQKNCIYTARTITTRNYMLRSIRSHQSWRPSLRPQPSYPSAAHSTWAPGIASGSAQKAHGG